MEIEVVRIWKSDIAITGTCSVDGFQKWFTLELPELFDGQANVRDKTCIPAGTYQLQRLFSPHFGRMMPHVMDVPGRSAIEIHWGNYPSDVLGCILLGETRINDMEIGQSREAFDEFDNEFASALASGDSVTLKIG